MANSTRRAASAWSSSRKLPVGESARAHAATHGIVENQAAMGHATVVPTTLDRLMRDGLDRHDAVHAIGSVLLQIVRCGHRKGSSRGRSMRSSAASSPS